MITHSEINNKSLGRESQSKHRSSKKKTSNEEEPLGIEETFDLQPKVNPSNMLSSLDSNQDSNMFLPMRKQVTSKT